MRAHFTIEFVKGVCCLMDLDDGSMSITNDAEAVVNYLFAHGIIAYGDKIPVIYCDTDGMWDGMRIRGNEFAGFVPIGTPDIDEAVEYALLQR